MSKGRLSHKKKHGSEEQGHADDLAQKEMKEVKTDGSASDGKKEEVISDGSTSEGKKEEFTSDGSTSDGKKEEFTSDGSTSEGMKEEFTSDGSTSDGKKEEFTSDGSASEGEKEDSRESESSSSHKKTVTQTDETLEKERNSFPDFLEVPELQEVWTSTGLNEKSSVVILQNYDKIELIYNKALKEIMVNLTMETVIKNFRTFYDTILTMARENEKKMENALASKERLLSILKTQKLKDPRVMKALELADSWRFLLNKTWKEQQVNDCHLIKINELVQEIEALEKKLSTLGTKSAEAEEKSSTLIQKLFEMEKEKESARTVIDQLKSDLIEAERAREKDSKKADLEVSKRMLKATVSLETCKKQVDAMAAEKVRVNKEWYRHLHAMQGYELRASTKQQSMDAMKIELEGIRRKLHFCQKETSNLSTDKKRLIEQHNKCAKTVRDLEKHQILLERKGESIEKHKEELEKKFKKVSLFLKQKLGVINQLEGNVASLKETINKQREEIIGLEIQVYRPARQLTVGTKEKGKIIQKTGKIQAKGRQQDEEEEEGMSGEEDQDGRAMKFKKLSMVLRQKLLTITKLEGTVASLKETINKQKEEIKRLQGNRPKEQGKIIQKTGKMQTQQNNTKMVDERGKRRKQMVQSHDTIYGQSGEEEESSDSEYGLKIDGGIFKVQEVNAEDKVRTETLDTEVKVEVKHPGHEYEDTMLSLKHEVDSKVKAMKELKAVLIEKGQTIADLTRQVEVHKANADQYCQPTSNPAEIDQSMVANMSMKQELKLAQVMQAAAENIVNRSIREISNLESKENRRLNQIHLLASEKKELEKTISEQTADYETCQILVNQTTTILRRCESSVKEKTHELNETYRQRDILGAMLMRRNAEVDLLSMKMSVMEKVNDRGQRDYKARLSDIHVLSKEVTRLRTQVKAFKSKDKLYKDLRLKLDAMEKDQLRENVLTEIDKRSKCQTTHPTKAMKGVMKQSLRAQVLDHCLVSQARFVPKRPGGDIEHERTETLLNPSQYELMLKTQTLTRKLILTSDRLTSCQLELKNKEAFVLQMQETLGRRVDVSLSPEMEQTRNIIRDKTKSLKAITAEYNMNKGELDYAKESVRLLHEKLRLHENEKKEFNCRPKVKAQYHSTIRSPHNPPNTFRMNPKGGWTLTRA